MSEDTGAAGDDPFDLRRFVEAQAGVHAGALAEIRRGRKTGHWMWFVFPQLKGLGASAMSERYGIASLAEARAYLSHPLLGPRYRACVSALQDLVGVTAKDVFGEVDAAKLASSLTLFAAAAPDDTLIGAALARWCGGRPDAKTLARLADAGPR